MSPGPGPLLRAACHVVPVLAGFRTSPPAATPGTLLARQCPSMGTQHPAWTTRTGGPCSSWRTTRRQRDAANGRARRFARVIRACPSSSARHSAVLMWRGRSSGRGVTLSGEAVLDQRRRRGVANSDGRAPARRHALWRAVTAESRLVEPTHFPAPGRSGHYQDRSGRRPLRPAGGSSGHSAFASTFTTRSARASSQ